MRSIQRKFYFPACIALVAAGVKSVKNNEEEPPE